MKILAILYLLITLAVGAFLLFAIYKSAKEKNIVACVIWTACLVPLILFFSNIIQEKGNESNEERIHSGETDFPAKPRPTGQTGENQSEQDNPITRP